MIDFDGLRHEAEGFLEDHADQIDKGIDAAARAAGKKYGHDQQIQQGADKLEELLPGGDEHAAADAGADAHHGGAQGARHAGGGRSGAGPGGRAGGRPQGRAGGRPGAHRAQRGGQ